MQLRPGQEIELAIETLGARGDGIGHAGGVPIYVPLTAPGDRVRARIEAKRGDGFAATAIGYIARAPSRREPLCRHFGACGGCAWQHLGEADYAAVKRDLLIDALKRHRLEAEVAPSRVSPPRDRRRVRFTGMRESRGVTLGLRERAGHAIVDLKECHVATPAIVALLEPARKAAATLDLLAPSRKAVEFQIAVTEAETGLDATWTLPKSPALPDRERLARFANDGDLARVSWRLPTKGDDEPVTAEPIAQRRPVRIGFGGAPVDLPPDAFLQASAAGEAAIREIVLEAVASAPAGPVADLYAGVGTLSLPLAQMRKVLAVDGDEAAIAALRMAARKAGLNRLTAERRDLSRRPLTAEELAQFRAVVFDPPRAGALAQARTIARSKVPVVVAVSCDPATLARDLRALADGGYGIARVTPIDQFLWSPRIEAVAVLRR